MYIKFNKKYVEITAEIEFIFLYKYTNYILNVKRNKMKIKLDKKVKSAS